MARNSLKVALLVVSIVWGDLANSDNSYAEIDEYIVKADYPKARRLLEEMSEHGETEAMYRLANMYRAGTGIPQDLSASLRWYEQAASLGYIPAQYMAAQCYERGIGTTKNIIKAANWYTKAARAGDARAQQRLDNLASKPAELLALMALDDEDRVLAQLRDRDLTVGDEQGQSLLMAAAAAGHVRVIRQLIASGAAPDQRDRANRTALIYAADRGEDAAIEALLDAGADPNAADRNGDTALHVATGRRHPSSVKLLTSRGADTAVRNSAGWTAAQLAEAKGIAADPSKGVASESLDARGRLAGLRKDKRFDGWPDLNVAAWSGDEEMVRLVLPAATASLNAIDGSGHSALSRAVDQGRVATVQILIDAGAKTDLLLPGGQSLVALAIEHGFDAVAEQLLAAGAPLNMVDTQGRFPLGLAATRSDSAMLDQLLVRGADPNVADGQGRNALMIAADSPATSASLRALLTHGANIISVDATQRSAIWYAAGGCDPAQLTLLLDALRHHAVRFPADTEGVTPLHRAVLGHGDGCVGLLLQAGHDPNVSSKSGSTPLHVAALKGDPRVAKLLVDDGAALNARDVQGDTPLYLAAKAQRYEMAEFLLKCGADPRIRNNNAVSAYDLARNASDKRWSTLFDEQSPSVLSLLGSNN